MGWPLGRNAGGGSFLYHLENNQVYVGFVVHLNYENPHLYPYMEFQRWKHHPDGRRLLKGGKRVAYGARAIAEGGWQSIPKLVSRAARCWAARPGWSTCRASRATTTRCCRAIAAAEAAPRRSPRGGRATSSPPTTGRCKRGPIGRDLRPVRNVKPLWSRWGLSAASCSAGSTCGSTLSRRSFAVRARMRHGKTDAEATGKAEDFAPIDYPKPDGVLSFDRLTNVAYSFTNHAEDQPAHLTLKDPDVPIAINLPRYAEPAQRYCPAGVYEVVREDDGSNPRFVINFQNCVHCKTCDIKDPSQNIDWVTPQGGDGPNYPNM
jgi:electron-transferring-flavoprotein dehydrogenase